MQPNNEAELHRVVLPHSKEPYAPESNQFLALFDLESHAAKDNEKKSEQTPVGYYPIQEHVLTEFPVDPARAKFLRTDQVASLLAEAPEPNSRTTDLVKAQFVQKRTVLNLYE